MGLVVHCKREPFDVYIGRPSMWGNPFVIGRHGDRDEVLRLYEDYVRNEPTMIAALPDLKGKVLGCWCHPLACHGDILVRLIEEFVK